MRNIIWAKPGGGVAITALAAGVVPQTHAAELQARGSVPADWQPVAFNATIPAGHFDALRWQNGALTRAQDWQPPAAKLSLDERIAVLEDRIKQSRV
jgi:N-glycosylase/DNA lyase